MIPNRAPGRILRMPSLNECVRVFAIATVLCHPSYSILGNGIYRNGVGARSMSMAGADVAWAKGPLASFGSNPAGLSFLEAASLELSLIGAKASGDFENRVNAGGHLHKPYGVVPDFGFAIPLRSTRVTLGLAVVPDALLNADWRYDDAPGGLDGATTYGRRKHRAEIVAVRSAIGIGFEVGPMLSLGASASLLYNRNVLQAPYIFQSQPALQGIKTLLDLNTDGFGYNGSFGVIFTPVDPIRVGLAYTTMATVHSDGHAIGDASVQLKSLGGAFAAAQSDFRYDAEVVNHFPRVASGGVSWQTHPRLRVGLQLDWIDWSDAFDQLEIRLSNGNNADINGLVGSAAAEDFVPLNWRDRIVYRAGIEWMVKENIALRAGYSYGRSPVPDDTLTPLTAAIMEHTIAAGVGYETGRFEFNLGYQYDLAVSRNVGASQLRSGEYSNSRIEAGIHWIGVSTLVRF